MARLRLAVRALRRPRYVARHSGGRRNPTGHQTHLNYGRPLTETHPTGGTVKLFHLATAYPHSNDNFSTYYFNSTRLPPDLPALWLASRLRGRRIVVNQNGCTPPYLYPYLPNAQSRNDRVTRGLQVADFVIYQTTFCRSISIEILDEDPSRWTVLNNPVDLSEFHPRPRENHPAGPIHLLLAGTQHMAHRVVFGIEVLAELRRGGHDAELTITGDLSAMYDADGSALLDDLARRHHLREKITVTGRYSRKDAPSIMASADVLLHPQFNDPCPGVVLEALASGVPVVGSRSGGTAELVDGTAGRLLDVQHSLVEVHLPSALDGASAVVDIMNAHESFRQNARRSAEERFGLEKWIRRHHEIFQHLNG